MKVLILGEGVDLTAVANQTGVLCSVTPFLPNRNVVCPVQVTGATGTPTLLIQGATESTFASPTTLVTHTALYSKRYNIQTMPYMRIRVSVAGSAGTASAYCENGA